MRLHEVLPASVRVTVLDAAGMSVRPETPACPPRTSDPRRRDRLLLLGAMAMAWLTVLGAAGESLGMDRMLKDNTVKRARTHSFGKGAGTMRCSR